MASRSAVLVRSMLALALVLGLTVLGLTGCSNAAPSSPAEQLPAAPDLLTRSADAMAKIKTIGLDVRSDPALTAMTVRSANGKLTATGEAIGSAVLNQGSSPIEVQFVVTKGYLYLKGPTGGYQALPLVLAAGIYDPTALLRPDGGVAALLRTATAGVTEASDNVNGVPAYRVRANLDPRVTSTVVPEIGAAPTGRVWLDKVTSRLLKAQVDVPLTPSSRPSADAADQPTAPVTVILSDFDAPVTVTAPAAS